MTEISPGASQSPETASVVIELTLLRKDREPFTKTIDFVDGELIQTGGSQGMKFGKAYLLQVTGLTGLAQVIRRMSCNEALALGVFEGVGPVQEWSVIPPPQEAIASATVIMQHQLQSLRDSGYVGAISRNADCIKYAIGRPVVVLLDNDLKQAPPHWSSHFAAHPEVVWECYCVACPGLIGAGHVYRRSTSAALSHPPTGRVFPGSGGTHNYIIASDSTDIPRALTALHERLWLCGYGWGYIADHGGILPRSLADRVVGKGEHPCFEANPVLLGGLVQDAAARMPVVVEGSIVDTRTAIPDLTVEERVQLNKLWAAEQERLADKAAVVREAWVRAKAVKKAEETGRDLDECIAEVERSSHTKISRPTAERPYCWSAELMPSFELLFRDPALEGSTVADVLSDPLRFKNEPMADPHGGLVYDPRRDKAIVVWPRDAKPYIFSRAHGDGVYELVDDNLDWTLAGVRGRQSKALFAAAGEIEEDPNAPPPPKQRRRAPTTRGGRYTAQTRRFAESMLWQGVSSSMLLDELHKQNNTRDYPLLPQEVDQIAVTAAEAQWSKQNV